jgi:hypothetical protein
VKTSIPQIFEEVEKAGSKEAKIKTLRAYDHPILKGMLQINFDPNVKMSLPEGEPPYKKDTSVPAGYSESNLYVEFRRFYIWLQNDVNLTRARKEQLFIQLLEGIHWTEAEAVCLAKDRKLQTKYKSLKEDLVREAFPGLLPHKQIIPPLGEPKAKKADSLNAS